MNEEDGDGTWHGTHLVADGVQHGGGSRCTRGHDALVRLGVQRRETGDAGTGWQASAGLCDAAPARGLDGAALQFQSGVVERLTIGALEWSDVPARRGGVPVFNTMQNRDQSMALLGSGFLRRLDRVALDFVTLKVELTP